MELMPSACVSREAAKAASTLRDSLKELVAKGEKKILLNLGDVTYIDSSGIGELVSGFTTVTNGGGSLKLLGLNKRVKDLLRGKVRSTSSVPMK